MTDNVQPTDTTLTPADDAARRPVPATTTTRDASPRRSVANPRRTRLIDLPEQPGKAA